MGIRRQGEGGNADVEWRPLPAGLWTFEVVSAEFEAATKKDWADQIRFSLKLTEAETERLYAEMEELEQGEQQSYRVSYRCGATLNGARRDGYRATKLALFLTDLLGSRQVTAVGDWIRNGAGPDGDDDEATNRWLEWFVGLQVDGLIRHSAPNANGVVYANLAGTSPRKDAEYNEFGAQKLAEMIRQTGGAAPATQAYETFREALATVATADALKAIRVQIKAAQGDLNETQLQELGLLCAQAKLSIEAPREPVAAGVAPGRKYEELFGDDDS